MPGLSNSKGNLTFLKKRYDANKAAGEKLVGSDFWMVINGHTNMSILIRTAQLPEIAREDVEDFAPSGMKFSQYGAYRNSGEIACTAQETLSGLVLTMVKNAVINKEMVDIDFYLAPESMGGEGNTPIARLEDCKLNTDAVDLSAEDVTALVRPNIRIVYNWHE
ncbi:baseplate protein [Citrobacter freundii]|uniref:baseplate protein n=1 Tax=Citrobacter freundii TaxID=546 RepID=UPI002B243D46|nr:baseplate protein [Citrobacter freundii]MEB2478199.1 baseplate protein [Citrobacter freundii]